MLQFGSHTMFFVYLKYIPLGAKLRGKERKDQNRKSLLNIQCFSSRFYNNLFSLVEYDMYDMHSACFSSLQLRYLAI